MPLEVNVDQSAMYGEFKLSWYIFCSALHGPYAMVNFDTKGRKGRYRLDTHCMRWYTSLQKPVAKLTGLISDLDMDD